MVPKSYPLNLNKSMLLFLIPLLVVPLIVVSADVDVRTVVVTTDGEKINLHHETSHKIFVTWLKNVTYLRIKDALSYSFCNSKKNVSSLIKDLDGIKYSILQLLHAFSIGDSAFAKLLLEINEKHNHSTTNLSDWIDSSFKFPQQDMYKVLKNAISWNVNLNYSYPTYVKSVLCSIVEDYKLFDKFVVNDISGSKWLLHNGCILSDKNVNLLEILWSRHENDFLKEVIEVIGRKNSKVLQVISKLITASNETFMDFLVSHELNDILDHLLETNKTNLETILAVALEKNKTGLVVKYRSAISISNRNHFLEGRLLLSSVAAGDIYIVNNLIEYGTPVNIVDEFGLTPLYKALESNIPNKDEIIQALIKAGANYKSVTESGRSLLSIAVSQNNVEVLKKLLSLNASPVEPDADGQTPLQIAISKNEPELLEILIRSTSNISNLTIKGGSPTHYGTLNGSNRILEMLLDVGAPVDSLDSYRNSPLCLAANGTDRLKILILAEYGANVSRRCESGNSPLHFAINQRSYKIVRVLTVLGADTNMINDDKQSPLYIATKVNSSKIIEYLLSKGADIKFRSDNGDTLLHVAAMHGSTDAVNKLLEYGVFVDIKNYKGETPLQIAVRFNKANVITLLARQGANIHYLTGTGDSLLHIAISEDSIEAIAALMKLGLRHTVVNYFGHSAISRAILSNNYHMVWEMINNTTPAALNVDMAILAASTGSLESLRAIIDYWDVFKMNINTVDAQTGWTPLSEAVKGNHPSVVLFLIEKGADINIKSRIGDTLIHLAARNGSTDVLRVLRGFPLPLDSTNSKGETPLWLATKFGHLEVMKLLKTFGADIHVRCICQWQNGSLLLPAAYSGNERAVLWLLSQGLPVDDNDILGVTALQEASATGGEEAVRVLLDNGADVDKSDINGLTPLHKAAYNGHASVSQILINYGASINLQAVNKLTPLHHAASNGYLTIVKLLCAVKAELDVQDTSGWTPLHWAAYKGHTWVAYELLNSGASINITANNGYTPITIAQQRNHTEVIYILREFPRLKGAINLI